MVFDRQLEALTAPIDSLKEKYSGYAAALRVLAELEPLVDAGLIPELIRARQGFPKGRSSESYSRNLKKAISIARTETRGGLSFLAGVCTIALCAFLEDAVKEVVANEITQHPKRWKGPESPLTAAPSLEKARELVRKRVRKDNTETFQKLNSLLADVGWVTEAASVDLPTLHEMYEIRNVVVHNGGRVDDRLKRGIAHLASAEVGSPVPLDEKRFREYVRAADGFISALITGQL